MEGPSPFGSADRKRCRRQRLGDFALGKPKLSCPVGRSRARTQSGSQAGWNQMRPCQTLTACCRAVGLGHDEGSTRIQLLRAVLFAQYLEQYHMLERHKKKKIKWTIGHVTGISWENITAFAPDSLKLFGVTLATGIYEHSQDTGKSSPWRRRRLR